MQLEAALQEARSLEAAARAEAEANAAALRRDHERRLVELGVELEGLRSRLEASSRWAVESRKREQGLLSPQAAAALRMAARASGARPVQPVLSLGEASCSNAFNTPFPALAG